MDESHAEAESLYEQVMWCRKSHLHVKSPYFQGDGYKVALLDLGAKR